MSAYTSFISDVHKCYRVEKIVLHHLIFLLIKITKRLSISNAISSQLQISIKGCGIKLRLEPYNTH